MKKKFNCRANVIGVDGLVAGAFRNAYAEGQLTIGGNFDDPSSRLFTVSGSLTHIESHGTDLNELLAPFQPLEFGPIRLSVDSQFRFTFWIETADVIAKIGGQYIPDTDTISIMTTGHARGKYEVLVTHAIVEISGTCFSSEDDIMLSDFDDMNIQLYEWQSPQKKWYDGVNSAALHFFVTGKCPPIEMAFKDFITHDAFRWDTCGRYSDDIIRIFVAVQDVLPHDLKVKFRYQAIALGDRIATDALAGRQMHGPSLWSMLYLLTADKKWVELCNPYITPAHTPVSPEGLSSHYGPIGTIRLHRAGMSTRPFDMISSAIRLSTILVSMAGPGLPCAIGREKWPLFGADATPGSGANAIFNLYVYCMCFVPPPIKAELKWCAIRLVEAYREWGYPLYVNAADLAQSGWDEVTAEKPCGISAVVDFPSRRNHLRAEEAFLSEVWDEYKWINHFYVLRQGWGDTDLSVIAIGDPNGTKEDGIFASEIISINAGNTPLINGAVDKYPCPGPAAHSVAKTAKPSDAIAASDGECIAMVADQFTRTIMMHSDRLCIHDSGNTGGITWHFVDYTKSQERSLWMDQRQIVNGPFRITFNVSIDDIRSIENSHGYISKNELTISLKGDKIVTTIEVIDEHERD